MTESGMMFATIAQNISLYDTALVGVSSELLNQTSLLRGIISDDVRDVFLSINYAILCGIMSVFGTVTNAINIVVFFKTGFKDAVNINFFALAISDLGCCFTIIIMALCFNPYFAQLDLPFEPFDFQYLTSGWPHMTFTRITSCITAFITVERCLCVSFPLKVKEIITPKRAAIFLACVTVVVVLLIVPEFTTTKFDWKFSEGRNRSILVLVFIDNSAFIDVKSVTKPIQGIFIPFATFLVVLFATVVLVVTLRRKAKWRVVVVEEEGGTRDGGKSSNSLSARDAKVSASVVVIAAMFIVCYAPVIVSYIVVILVPGYGFIGRYRNICLVMFSFHFFTETLNSGLNIFIYYRVSSVYKSTFLQLFGLNLKTKKNNP